jgi:hypothetical protein
MEGSILSISITIEIGSFLPTWRADFVSYTSPTPTASSFVLADDHPCKRLLIIFKTSVSRLQQCDDVMTDTGRSDLEANPSNLNRGKQLSGVRYNLGKHCVLDSPEKL